jgi:hypothetical protein
MAKFSDYASTELENVKKQLDEESSFLMQLLRGHFLLEQKLNEMLYLLVRNPDVLQKSNSPRIDFNTKTFIIRSLAPEAPMGEFCWPALSKFNSIRNKMAHGLESDKLDKGIDDFIKYMKENDSVFKKRILGLSGVTTEQECVLAICALYSFFTVYTQKVKELKKNV